jgi:hypothetical protein
MYQYSRLNHEDLLPLCSKAPAEPDPDGWITGVENIAKHCRCHPATVRNRIKDGLLYSINPKSNRVVSNTAWIAPPRQANPQQKENIK